MEGWTDLRTWTRLQDLLGRDGEVLGDSEGGEDDMILFRIKMLPDRPLMLLLFNVCRLCGQPLGGNKIPRATILANQ
jgi:hypothetical protein